MHAQLRFFQYLILVDSQQISLKNSTISTDPLSKSKIPNWDKTHKC